MPGSRFMDALSHAELGALVETIDEGFVLQDASLGVVAANPSAARLLGEAKPDSLSIGNIRRCIDQEGRPITPEMLPSGIALASGQAVKDVVLGVVRHDERLIWLRVSAWPVTLGGGSQGVASLFVDVTPERALIDEARRATEALTETESRLRSILASIDDYLYAWRYHADGSVDVTFESMSAPSFLEWEAGADAETVWRAAVVPEDLEEFDDKVLGAQRRAQGGEHDYRIRTQSGRLRWLHERWRARVLDDGSTLGEGIVSDITLRREIEERADRLARTDALTGAANRREFHDRLGPMLARKRRRAPIALALLDVDHFKAVNDTYGHRAGDEVLVEVARRLAGELGPNDLLARWGGEEFAVYLHDVGDAQTARARCEELRLAIANEPARMTQGELRITISIGAAIAAVDDTADELIDRADGALYQAKRAGRNRTRLVREPVTGADQAA
jgi:diguanylate cyclase (GGDEF)-like protein